MSFGQTGPLALPSRGPERMTSTASSHNHGRSSQYSPSRRPPSDVPQASSSRASYADSLYPPPDKLVSSTSQASSVSALSNSMPSPAQSRSVSEPCVACGSELKQTFTCVQCNNDAFCEDCWGKERPHRPGAVGVDGLPHEKTNREVVERLRLILDPKRSTEEQQSAHRSDEDTTWFGIARDSANLPIFQDYGRYAAIMTESQTPEINVRYPQLVSFIGQTGAGKSTLIKMLIDNQESVTGPRTNRRGFPSPVTGTINDNIPTSGDVHLYSDPATYSSATPMLYADCEGLDGGENVPRGARFKHRDTSVPPTSRSSSSNDPTFRKKMRKVAHSSQRDIVWATTPETRKREYAVTQLYPRLLYTFSDVVVFVLRNARVFESTVLEKLLDWASASIEKSLNQPALPHAIIALNATDNSIEARQWDVQEATQILMSDIAGAIHRVPRFQEYALLWQSRGKVIKTTKDLLECFYSSITVVRIPTRGRYMLIDEQIGKLHTEIKRSCKAAYLTKRRVRMLSNGDKLQVYLQSAFDHFSQNLDAPFDFVKEAIKINPIPRDFRGNILKLAIAIRDHNRFPNQDDGPRIFQELSQMVASCVLLDVVRHSLLGTAAQLLEDHYADFCDDALFDFCSMYWPCNFKNRHGRCVNMRSGHNPKGHQNSEGRIIAAGDYQSNFHADDYADDWYENIRRNLDSIQRALQDVLVRLPHMTEQHAVSDLHREKMNDFYRLVGQASDFVSHSTCFSCLRELPEHPLPCGHVLCTPCVEAYGRRTGKTTIKLDACPLHVRETTWLSPWGIRIKPQYAGVRVLSLDGGGVRGIVELEVLRALERALGGELPIQGFFDLIVGTSTGGIIALGLGVENWSVDSCINKFTDLVRHAFAPREFHGVWGFEHLATARHGSKYRTRPFEKALQDAFADKPLFGGQEVQEGYMLKVAVTSTTYVDQHPVLLTNYNRPEPQNFLSYKFERHDRPAMEMRTWEAARATSAAPPYFKPFIKNETKSSYLDGALYHNNPVWVAHHERKLIWSDVAPQQPDIFLSIGTGHHGPNPKERTLETRRLLRRSTGDSNTSEQVPQPEVHPRSTTTILPFGGQIWNTVSGRFDNILNCSRIWDSFRLDVLEPYSGHRRRYIRLNPDLRFKVPSLDEVDRLHDLRTTVAKEMQHNPKLKEIAHRLIASTFFFEKVDSSTKENKDRFECKGFICCRFNNSSHEMKALGRYLHKYLTVDFTPYFVIQEDRRVEMSRKVIISEQCISDMIVRGRFELDRIPITTMKQLSSTTISLCLQESPYPNSSDSYLPISGFPRTLMAEDTIHKVASHAASSRNSGSFISRPHRRRRQEKRQSSSGGTSPPEPSSLRRVKSQTNLKQAGVNPGQKAYPENPEDVKDWAKRRKSIDTIVDAPARNVFELADTSATMAPSEMPFGYDNYGPPSRKASKFVYK